jgi:hypothetical protein
MSTSSLNKRRTSKHRPQREDEFVRQLRQFMKDQHYTQFDIATNLNCSQVCCDTQEAALLKK